MFRIHHHVAALVTCLGVGACAMFAPADARAASVTPGLSRVSAQAQMGTPLVTVFDSDQQSGTLTPLAVDVEQTGGSAGTLSLDVDSAVHFTSANSGLVTQRHVRADSRTNGTGVIWGGVARFRYEFSVDAATTVVIDYDALGTSNVAFDALRWSGMQGFTVSVNHDTRALNWSLIDLQAFPNTPASPLPLTGQFAWNIGPGDGFIEIQLAASSSASNGGGTRLMQGSFAFQIGDAPVTPIPLPASLPALLVALAPLVAGTRRTRFC